MVGYVKNLSATIENDQYKVWGEHIQQMITILRAGNENNMQFFRRGIWVAHEIHAGHILCKH
eukprot:14921745-Heterocapsa_arctica.AAC.1